MDTLDKKWYQKIKRGQEVTCPKKGCEGLVVKVSGEIFNQNTEIYWEQTTFYRCTRNCKHVWKYFINSLD